MQWTTSSETLTSTAFIHHFVCNFLMKLQGLWGWKILFWGEGFLDMILVLRIMQKNTIIDQTCRRRCMRMLQEFHTIGQPAGILQLSVWTYMFLLKVCVILLYFIIFSVVGSDVLINNWNDSEDSMLPTYKELIKAGLRIWVFR